MKSYHKRLLPIYISRFVVGILFFFSGFVKINDVLGFSYKLEEYFHVFEQKLGIPYSLFGPYSLNLATLIGILEVVLAVNLMIGMAPGFTTTVMLIMILFFTFLTGFSMVTHAVADCGCFGDVLKLSPGMSFTKDIILLLLIGYLWINREQIYALSTDIVRSIVGWGIAILAPIYAWYCFHYLPVFDFMPYHVGADLKHKTTTRNTQGELLAKDYEPIKNTCQVDEFQGNVLLVLIKDFNSANPEEVVLIQKLINSLAGSDVKVLGATGTPNSQVELFKKQYGMNYCFAPMDGTVIKSMIRANPGTMLLKNGVVMGKWGARNTPDKERLMKFLK